MTSGRRSYPRCLLVGFPGLVLLVSGLLVVGFRSHVIGCSAEHRMSQLLGPSASSIKIPLPPEATRLGALLPSRFDQFAVRPSHSISLEEPSGSRRTNDSLGATAHLRGPPAPDAA